MATGNIDSACGVVNRTCGALLDLLLAELSSRLTAAIEKSSSIITNVGHANMYSKSKSENHSKETLSRIVITLNDLQLSNEYIIDLKHHCEGKLKRS